MNAGLAALIAKSEASSPMSNGEVTTVPGRLLLADGDGLCYYCAGSDDTSPGQARINLLEKMASAARAAGAERVKILVTSRGSHKGHRYAVARVKPYQGQRTSSRRPANWQYLRNLLETGSLGDIEVEFTDIAEADDLFARYAKGHPDCVIYTQDKDMRMVPGWHLEWTTHILVHVPPGTWALEQGGKLYGRKWFWQQMLHGDTADNIPGLEWYTDGSLNKSGENKGQLKVIRCGEKSTAVAGLDDYSSDQGACLYLQGLYRTCYGDRWLLRMLEQAILLWMRNDPGSSPFNVVEPGHPLHFLTTHSDYPAARDEMLMRIAHSQVHAETEDDGSGDSADGTAGEAEREVRPVQSAVQEASAGPLPLGGACESDPVCGVQLAAGQGREQPQAVRRAEPVGVPAWVRFVSAKA